MIRTEPINGFGTYFGQITYSDSRAERGEVQMWKRLVVGILCMSTLIGAIMPIEPALALTAHQRAALARQKRLREHDRAMARHSAAVRRRWSQERHQGTARQKRARRLEQTAHRRYWAEKKRQGAIRRQRAIARRNQVQRAQRQHRRHIKHR